MNCWRVLRYAYVMEFLIVHYRKEFSQNIIFNSLLQIRMFVFVERFVVALLFWVAFLLYVRRLLF